MHVFPRPGGRKSFFSLSFFFSSPPSKEDFAYALFFFSRRGRGSHDFGVVALYFSLFFCEFVAVILFCFFFLPF